MSGKFLKIKSAIIPTFLLFLSFAIFCQPVPASSLNLEDAFKVNDGGVADPLDSAADKAGYNVKRKEGAATPETIISLVIETAMAFLGVIFLILTIYGGFLYLTAAGNDDKAKKALDIIKTSVIGLLIVTSAYIITRFVIERFVYTALSL